VTCDMGDFCLPSLPLSSHPFPWQIRPTCYFQGLADEEPRMQWMGAKCFCWHCSSVALWSSLFAVADQSKEAGEVSKERAVKTASVGTSLSTSPSDPPRLSHWSPSAPPPYVPE
jgi:hypothetical protein